MYGGGGGGGINVPAPAPTPPPIYTADDGTVFHNMNAYNEYQNQLRSSRFTQASGAAQAMSANQLRSAIEGAGFDLSDITSPTYETSGTPGARPMEPNLPGIRIRSGQAAGWEDKMDKYYGDLDAYENWQPFSRTTVMPENIYDPTNIGHQAYQKGMTEIERVKTGIPYLDPSPASYYSPTIGERILSGMRGQQRIGYEEELRGTMGEGFASELFAPTTDDPILQGILSGQQESAEQRLKNAFLRGGLTERGYQYGQEELGKQSEAGMGTLQDIGGGILGGYRQSLQDIAGRAYEQARTSKLGGYYDPQKSISAMQSLFGEQQERLSGDIYRSVGDMPFFDTSKIIGQAGIRQGVTEAPASIVAAALEQRERKKKEERGIGSQGSF